MHRLTLLALVSASVGSSDPAQAGPLVVPRSEASATEPFSITAHSVPLASARQTVSLLARAVNGVEYSWEQVSGPVVPIKDASESHASFVAPDLAAEATMTFQVTAFNGQARERASVRVRIQPLQADRAAAASLDRSVETRHAALWPLSVALHCPNKVGATTSKFHVNALADGGMLPYRYRYDLSGGDIESEADETNPTIRLGTSRALEIRLTVTDGRSQTAQAICAVDAR